MTSPQLDIAADHHMHSIYSDGSATIAEMGNAAIEKGLQRILITDHMPLPFKTRYAMNTDAVDYYRNDIHGAKETFSDRLQISMGMEIEYIPALKSWIEPFVTLGWDQLIVSVHSMVVDGTHFMVNGNVDELRLTIERCFQNDMKSYCRAYFTQLKEAVETGWFQILGHLDVLKKHNADNLLFDETENWYRKMVLELLDAIKKSGMTVEINTAGLTHPAAAPYPSFWIIDACIARRIPLVLSSDAHRPESLGQYFEKMNLLAMA